ncbi:hypothetical protein CR513_08268, partial [Mucuna pruriens]
MQDKSKERNDGKRLRVAAKMQHKAAKYKSSLSIPYPTLNPGHVISQQEVLVIKIACVLKVQKERLVKVGLVLQAQKEHLGLEEAVPARPTIPTKVALSTKTDISGEYYSNIQGTTRDHSKSKLGICNSSNLARNLLGSRNIGTRSFSKVSFSIEEVQDQDLGSQKLSEVIAQYSRRTPMGRNLNVWPSVVNHYRPSKNTTKYELSMIHHSRSDTWQHQPIVKW